MRAAKWAKSPSASAMSNECSRTELQPACVSIAIHPRPLQSNLPMFKLNDRIAFVTGVATGLGQAIALALARSGADLAITDRNIDRLDETETAIKSCGRRVLKLSLDVRDLAQIKAGITEAERFFGRIDILVNNA